MSMQAQLKIACCSGDLHKVRDILSENNLSAFLKSREGYLLLCVTLKNSVLSESQLSDLGVQAVYTQHFLSHFLFISKLLLLYGINVNNDNALENSDTALHFAVHTKNTQIVEMLLAKEANVDAKNENLDTPLHIAVRKNASNVAELLFKHGADTKMVNSQGHGIVHLLVQFCDEEMLNLFLQYNNELCKPFDQNVVNLALNRGSLQMMNFVLDGIDSIEQRDDNGLTILQAAVQNSNTEMVKFLLEKGSNINAKTKSGETVLHIAIAYEQEEVVEFLLKHGAKFDVDARGFSPLHKAIKMNSEKIVSLLLKNGCNVNAVTNRGSTPLHLAMEYECCSSIRNCLLENHANLKAKDNQGLIPLNYAVKNRNLEDIDILLDKNPDINDRDINSAFCFSFIEDEDDYYEENEQSVAKLFIDRGFTIFEKDLIDVRLPAELYFCLQNRFKKEQFITLVLKIFNKNENRDFVDVNKFCLMYIVLLGAVKKGFINIVNSFLKNVNVNASLENGDRLLHLACKNGHLAIVEELVKRGAHVNSLNLKKMSALHFSAMCNNCRITELLLEKKAEIDAFNQENRTPLFLAVQEKNFKTIQLLLNAGANVNSVDVKKRSPLHEAVNIGEPKIVEMLLLHGAIIERKHSCDVIPIFQILESRSVFCTDIIDILFNYGAKMSDLKPQMFNDPKECARFKIKSVASEVDCFDFLVDSSMTDFQIMCQNEINQMKLVKIYGFSISIYDLLIKCEKQIAVYMRNEDIVQILDKIDLQRKFPIFANKLKVRVMIGKQKNRLVDLSFHCLELILKTKVPIVIAQEICSYLDEIDLRRLIIASPIDSEMKKKVQYDFKNLPMQM